VYFAKSGFPPPLVVGLISKNVEHNKLLFIAYEIGIIGLHFKPKKLDHQKWGRTQKCSLHFGAN